MAAARRFTQRVIDSVKQFYVSNRQKVHWTGYVATGGLAWTVAAATVFPPEGECAFEDKDISSADAVNALATAPVLEQALFHRMLSNPGPGSSLALPLLAGLLTLLGSALDKQQLTMVRHSVPLETVTRHPDGTMVTVTEYGCGGPFIAAPKPDENMMRKKTVTEHADGKMTTLVEYSLAFPYQIDPLVQKWFTPFMGSCTAILSVHALSETLMRGALRQWTLPAAFVTSNVLFAGVHGLNFKQVTTYNLSSELLIHFPGLCATALLSMRCGFWYGVAAHSLHNALVLALEKLEDYLDQ